VVRLFISNNNDEIPQLYVFPVKVIKKRPLDTGSLLSQMTEMIAGLKKGR